MKPRASSAAILSRDIPMIFLSFILCTQTGRVGQNAHSHFTDNANASRVPPFLTYFLKRNSN